MLFFFICCLAVAILSLVLFIWGCKTNNATRKGFGFALALILAIGLMFAQFTPTNYETMKVVHVNQATNTLTLIDSDGKAFYVDCDKIANVGEFAVDQKVIVVQGGLMGDIKFVTPGQ